MIAGRAGDGVLFTGNVLARILKREGWEVVTCRDFPSNIRGEATSYIVRASLDRIGGRGDCLDVLLAFDCDAVSAHIREIARGGVVFCDGEKVAPIPESEKANRTFHPFPLRSLARSRFGREVFKNMIALGALSYVLNLNHEILQRIISEMFLARKGGEVVAKNNEAFMLGWNQAKDVIDEAERHPLVKSPDSGRVLCSGNEAIAFGALAAGCRLFASYPICPASEIWQMLALHMPRFNGAVVQTEDEVAALNMALGASYAGARAMTSTSGPGASLMMEAFSLSGMAEIPVVVAHVQRVGPSTGTPTKTEQSDITQWIFGSHGDFPRIVLAPGSIEECFELTVRAFNLAEKYQCPVILMSELDMGQNLRTAREFDFKTVVVDRGRLATPGNLAAEPRFKRYALTPDGVSPRAFPGQKNRLHMVEGNEHDECGYRDESPDLRVRMMEKRMRKLGGAGKDVPPPVTWGDAGAEIGIVGVGSTLGPITEAQEQLAALEVKSKFLQLRTLWPFPVKDVERFFNGCSRVFVVENNFAGQLARLIRSQVECGPRLERVLKYSSLPFIPAEISEKILRALA